MKTARRLRYYCDHCGKTGGSRYYMERHESGCTANPNRVCCWCARFEYEQPKLTDLIALLPDPTKPVQTYQPWDTEPPAPGAVPHSEWEADIAKRAKALREACGCCAACLLAAVRQWRAMGGRDFDYAESLDFKAKDEFDAMKAELRDTP